MKFWTLVGKVPFNIVFIRCSRLETVGFRWAPNSLAKIRVGAEMAVQEPPAEVTSQGLRYKWVIYVFESPARLELTRWIYDRVSRQHFQVGFIDEDVERSSGLVDKYDAIVALERLNYEQRVTYALLVRLVIGEKNDNPRLPRYEYGVRVYFRTVHVNDRDQADVIICRSDEKEILIS